MKPVRRAMWIGADTIRARARRQFDCADNPNPQAPAVAMSPTGRAARALLIPPRRSPRPAQLSRTGTVGRLTPGRGGVESDNETGFEPRTLRVLAGAARQPGGARARRDRAKRDPAIAGRCVRLGIRPPNGPPLPPRGHPRLRAVRTRTEERTVSR